MKALIIGATGSTGKLLVDKLLEDVNYTAVTIFVRKPTGRTNPKLTEHIVDLSNSENYRALITGDVLFSCLGTTLKAAGSKENQWKIDFDIPADFARIAKENGINSFVLISAHGASAKSSIFYSKMKGQLEDEIDQLNFNQYIIFRPALLQRDDSDRLGEKVMVKTLHFFNSIGLFKKYKPLPTGVLAEKAAKAPKILPIGKTIVTFDKIADF